MEFNISSTVFSSPCDQGKKSGLCFDNHCIFQIIWSFVYHIILHLFIIVQVFAIALIGVNLNALFFWLVIDDEE